MEEGRLGDPRLRENFVQRVFVQHRWRCLLRDGLTSAALIDFHASHKRHSWRTIHRPTAVSEE